MAVPFRSSDAKWVYLLSDVSYGKEGGYVNFTRSADRGQTWSSVQSLVSYTVDDDLLPSIAGGLGGEVLVAWGLYCEYCEYPQSPTQHIELRRSSDFGKSFSAAAVVRSDGYGDTAVAFGNAGTAHLVYNLRDYPFTVGSPMYVYSNKAPYTNWSSPVPLSDDISATDYSPTALTVSACGGASVLHAAWLDDRVGAGKYHVFYTRKVAKTGEAWSPNLRISGMPLAAAEPAYYTLVEGIVAGGGTAVGFWNQWATPSASSTPGPVWASRIASGGNCP